MGFLGKELDCNAFQYSRLVVFDLNKWIIIQQVT